MLYKTSAYGSVVPMSSSSGSSAASSVPSMVALMASSSRSVPRSLPRQTNALPLDLDQSASSSR